MNSCQYRPKYCQLGLWDSRNSGKQGMLKTHDLSKKKINRTFGNSTPNSEVSVFRRYTVDMLYLNYIYLQLVHSNFISTVQTAISR